MKKLSLELVVGIFVMVGVISLGWLSLKLGKREVFGGGYYSVYAEFESISGLRKNAEIEIGGVVIGSVSNISLIDGIPRVEMKIRKEIDLPNDTIVSVRSRGLIGDKILDISLGGSQELVMPGGIMIDTESTIDLENLISQFIFGKV